MKKTFLMALLLSAPGLALAQETDPPADPPVTTPADPPAPPPATAPDPAPAASAAAQSEQTLTALPVSVEPVTPVEVDAAAPPTVEETGESSADAGPIHRGNWYFGIGIGAGPTSMTSQSVTGSVNEILTFRGGVFLSDQLAVGLSIMLFGQWNGMIDYEDMIAAWSSIMAEGTFFPLAQLPWNVAFGFGWSSAFKWYSRADERGEAEMYNTSSDGFSWAIGTGWDLFAGPGFNLGFQARYDGASVGGKLGNIHVGSMNLLLNWY